MPEWSPLKIDMLNNIRNFVEMYPYPAAEAAMVEAIANCLDARATNIAIGTFVDHDGKEVLRVEDDGKGMTKEEFEEHYHALSISSKVKGEGIGFAGVGSKLYIIFLAAGGNILTETKSDQFHDASEIAVISGEPRWRRIERRQLQHRGTIYELKLTEEDADFLTTKRITEIIQTHYNAVLLGRYGNIIIRLNGEPVKPWRPAIDETKCQTGRFRIRGKEYRCFFELSKTDLGEKQGIEIVLFGKTIRSKQWFDLEYMIKPQLRPKITGQILADGLAPLLTTHKSDFRTQLAPGLWAYFRRKTYRAMSTWLSEIGALEEKQIEQTDTNLQSLCEEMEKEINRLLKDPTFSTYNPFLQRQTKEVLLPASNGSLNADQTTGAQTTAGNLGGEGMGAGINVAGPEDNSALSQSPTGQESADTVVRRVKHGIAINLDSQPNNPKEYWLRPEAIVINTGHPVSSKAEKWGYTSWAQHVLKCVFFVFLEQNPPQTYAETMDKLKEFYLKWSTVE